METRQIAPEEYEAYYVRCESTFAGDARPEDMAVERAVFEADRSLAVYDRGAIVGTAAAFSFEFSVPGGYAPVAGVSYVSVQPTHRRRGVATSLMRRQLDDVHEAGREAIAALWASEASIYGRYGYGLTALGGAVDLDLRHAAFHRPVAGEVRAIPTTDLPKLGGPAYERFRARRPGVFARDDDWWAHRLHDPEHHRSGATALRAAVTEDGDGYALYALKPEWPDGTPSGTVTVRELVAATPAAEAALWRFLLDHDLMGKLTTWNLPADTALLHLLADPRRARMRLRDNLWARLVDVPKALAQRRYATEGDVVLEVADEFCPWNAGRYALSGGPGGATCSPTTAPAGLTLSSTELGAAYFGGTRLTALHDAGRVGELTPGALRRADTMFGWSPLPWCPQVF